MFTFIVLPDLQAYSDLRLQMTQRLFKIADQRERMFRQVAWVREQAAALNVKMVFQEGDLTQTNFPDEWALTESALRGLDDVVPYLIGVGNHDMGYEKEPPPGRFWVSNRRDSLISEYFPPARFQNNPLYTYGGNFEGRSENYFLLFEAEGLHFIALSLEFMPRDEAIAWANDVLERHWNRRAIVMTHGYLDVRGARNLRGDHFPIEGNTAEEIWQKLLRKHPNIFLVLCGHDYGEARRTDIGDHGNEIHQLMANYQWWDSGGMGWLRILNFHPSEDRVDVRTYSPVLDRYRLAPSSQFSLSYAMSETTDTPTQLSLFQRRKLRHFFGVIDVDKTGFIERADFFALRDRFANMLGLDLDDLRYRRIEEGLTNAWKVHLGSGGAGRLGIRDFLGHWNANHAALRAGHDTRLVFAEVDEFAELLFDTFDANRDGSVGVIEFLLFLKALGIDEGQISTFQKLDVDKNGELSRREFRDHVREFFLGDDPSSPSNNLFGLLDHPGH